MTTRNSRNVPLDSGQMPLEGKRLMKFSPEINTGTIVQILVVVCSAFGIYAGLRDEQRQTKSDLDQVKAVAVVERAQTTQALTEVRTRLDKQGDQLQDIKESLAILRGRAAESPGSKR